jgi:predicted helicase
MGAKARRIRDDILETFELGAPDNHALVQIFNLMRRMLVHDLSKSMFADMYSQTLVYGLFVARYNDLTPNSFSRAEARSLVPKTNPFLRHFFDHIVGPDFDDTLSRAVDELCEVFRVSDVPSLVHAHLGKSPSRSASDPIIHFYEDFLHAYDPLLRKRMGAYYTPVPVVNFIVRQVDAILRNQFSLPQGLGDASRVAIEQPSGQVTKLRSPVDGRRTIRYDKQLVEYHRVQILDPAVGTATFLNETVKLISQKFVGQEGQWRAYVNDDLLPRLNGFELMMAPYTIAHLKLGMTLEDLGVSTLSRRIGVYLTNTLEEGIPEQPDIFTFGLAEAVTQEGEQAGRVKTDYPVMVVLGNPPYSVISSNLSEYQRGLIEEYKYVEGARITEKGALRLEMNLNDDYVKFIAFAQNTIGKTGQGILAYVNNNTWLEANSHRGMRYSLLSIFDEIYIINLSNASRGDENVFDIKQKVCMNIFVRKPGERRDEIAIVHRVDLSGKRIKKFKWLRESDIDSIEWTSFTPRGPQYELVDRDWEVGGIYTDFIPIDEIFMKMSTTVLTARDKFAIDFSKEALAERVKEFSNLKLSEEIMASRYGLKSNAHWNLPERRAEFHLKRLGPESIIQRYDYRPFDTRWLAYDDSIVQCTRNVVMRHVVGHKNIVLTTCRFITGDTWNHVFIGDKLVDDSYVSNRSKERGQAFVLYLFEGDGQRRANLSRSGLKSLLKNVSEKVTPEEVVDYIYAVLHSTPYRTTYLEFLRIGFPRIPPPSSAAEFRELGRLGARLRLTHLMEDRSVDDLITTYPIVGADVVEHVSYGNGNVYINDNQYFGQVPPSVWSYAIGAYRPAEKWLKDRRGMKLSSAGIVHYQKMIKALSETLETVESIDRVTTYWT